MFTSSVTLQLSFEELKEIHEALVQRALVEDEVRNERGEEEVEHSLLEKIERLVGENDAALHALDHLLEDELWEYAWYGFTDEWAWFRAKQEVKRELQSAQQHVDVADFEKRVELRYQKDLQMYISEIDMLEDGKKPLKIRIKQTKT